MLFAEEGTNLLRDIGSLIGAVAAAVLIPLVTLLIRAFRQARVEPMKERQELLKFFKDWTDEKDKAQSTILNKIADKFETQMKEERVQCRDQHESILARLDEISKASTANQQASERQVQALSEALVQSRRKGGQ